MGFRDLGKRKRLLQKVVIRTIAVNWSYVRFGMSREQLGRGQVY